MINIDDHSSKLRTIGYGSYAEIFLQTELNVVIKQLDEYYASTIKQEYKLAKIAGELKVGPKALGLNINKCQIYFEYLEGTNLGKSKLKKSKFSIELFRKIIEQRSILHKHKICHMDLHDFNIMITKTDEVKIIDFGLANQQKRCVYKELLLKDKFKTFVVNKYGPKSNLLTKLLSMPKLAKDLIKQEQNGEIEFNQVVETYYNELLL